MMRKLADFMIKDFPTVDVLDSLRQVRKIFSQGHYESLPVLENDQIVGSISYWNVMNSHPNRIAADAMSENFQIVLPDLLVWDAKELFDRQKTNLLIVKEQQQLLGIVDDFHVEVEIARHSDLLTGLYKPDYIYYQALKLLHSHQAFSFIFCDVNNFGEIDKKFGHIDGDCILKEISHLFQESLRPGAHLSRFGGDEFLILMTCGIDESCQFAQSLLHEVKHHTFFHKIPVSISAGITQGVECCLPDDEVYLLSKLINCASLASSKAKREHRELVIVSEAEFEEIG